MNQPITRRGAAWMMIALVASSLPAVFLHSVVSKAASLHALAQSGSAYWQPEHALLLYVGFPLVALSACVLVLAPGLLLALALDSASNRGEAVVQAFGLSLVLLVGGSVALHAFLPAPLSRTAFVAMVLVLTGLCFAALLMRMRRGDLTSNPFADIRARALIPALAPPTVLLAALVPKFLWDNFNGDGAHAYEAARLLLRQATPFWDPAAGAISFWPGTTSALFAYPASWFIQLFGPLEVSSRLPVILYLIVVFAGVLALAQHGRGRALDQAEQWLVWLALAVYTIAVGYSGTYSPYSADLALPAGQDTILVVCLLGFVMAAARGSVSWLAFWGVLAFLSLPNGILLMALWWVAMALLWKPRPYRLLIGLAVIGVGCVVLGALLPRLLTLLGGFAPGEELESGALLDRFNFLQVTDVRRLLFMIVPSGIMPALTLLAWRRQDQLARAITAVVLVYFGITYIQAYASLHYYIPAMLLPLAVFWRTDWVRPEHRKVWLAATAIAGLAALWLSLPNHTAPYTAARAVGGAIQDRVGGYQQSAADQFRSTALLGRLFPADWHHSVPDSAFGGSVLVWNYYAHTGDAIPANYILQRASAAPPQQTSVLSSEGGFSLYVRDSTKWAAHRALRPATPAGATIYQIPRDLLFRSGDGGLRIVEVKPLLRRLLP